MSDTLRIISAVIIALHGLIHLIGLAVYLKLAEFEGFAYKTTLLGGRWDLGEPGTQVFGVLWILPALGFIAAAAGMIFGFSWWGALLLGSAIVSLLLTTLDFRVAFAGIAVNVIILIALWFGARLA
ncbi:MAG: hypothetical protein P1P76_05260 [Anaerolineales bacterium]|nr:hypothetical protein [Anaerolineales bacterium]